MSQFLSNSTAEFPSVECPTLGTLVVVILKAKNLHNRRKVSKQNPFCTIRVSTESFKTKTITRGGQSPLWDHEVRFKICDRADHKELRISVFDQEKVSPHLIGETKIPLQPAFDAPKENGFDGWHEIQFQGQYVGEVFLEMTFYKAKSKPRHLLHSQSASSLSGSGQRRPLPTPVPRPSEHAVLSPSVSHHSLPAPPQSSSRPSLDHSFSYLSHDSISSDNLGRSSSPSGRRLPALPQNGRLGLSQQWAGSSSDLTETQEERQQREKSENSMLKASLGGLTQSSNSGLYTRAFRSVPDLVHSTGSTGSSNDTGYGRTSQGSSYARSSIFDNSAMSSERIENRAYHNEGTKPGYSQDNKWDVNDGMDSFNLSSTHSSVHSSPSKASDLAQTLGAGTFFANASLSSSIESGGLRRSPLKTWTIDEDHKLPAANSSDQQNIGQQINDWYGASLFR